MAPTVVQQEQVTRTFAWFRGCVCSSSEVRNGVGDIARRFGHGTGR
jgi:hypothetical protein